MTNEWNPTSFPEFLRDVWYFSSLPDVFRQSPIEVFLHGFLFEQVSMVLAAISLLLLLAARRPTLAAGITATLSLVSTVIAVVLLYDHVYWIHEASKLPPHPGELADGCNRVLWTPMFSMATYTLIVTSFCVGSVWKLLKERRQAGEGETDSGGE